MVRYSSLMVFGFKPFKSSKIARLRGNGHERFLSQSSLNKINYFRDPLLHVSDLPACYPLSTNGAHLLRSKTGVPQPQAHRLCSWFESRKSEVPRLCICRSLAARKTLRGFSIFPLNLSASDSAVWPRFFANATKSLKATSLTGIWPFRPSV